MKAVKRLFKRKKQREEEGVGDIRPPPTAPNRPILKPAPPVDKEPPRWTSNQSSDALTVRSDSHATRNTSLRVSEKSSPLLVAEKQKTPSSMPVSTESSGGNHGDELSKPASTRPASPTNTTGAKRPSIDQEKGTYKGVSESFKKGMSVTQRFGVGDAMEDQPLPDPNQLGKLADAYDSIPLLEQTKLPRGGISMETKAVGRIQVSSH